MIRHKAISDHRHQVFQAISLQFRGNVKVVGWLPEESGFADTAVVNVIIHPRLPGESIFAGIGHDVLLS